MVDATIIRPAHSFCDQTLHTMTQYGYAVSYYTLCSFIR